MTNSHATLIFIGFVCFVGAMCLLVLALQARQQAWERIEEERQDIFEHEIRLKSMDHAQDLERREATARQRKQVMAEGELLAKIASRVTGTMEGFTDPSSGTLNLKLDNRKTYAPKADTYIHPTVIAPVMPVQPVMYPAPGYYPSR